MGTSPSPFRPRLGHTPGCYVNILLANCCVLSWLTKVREAPTLPLPTDDVKNWMHMFRWIVKTIRDEYEVDETILTRSAVLESDCGLAAEQLEAVLQTISDSFSLRFPPGTLDEVVMLEELCMLAAWMKGMYKRPEFISAAFEQTCRAANAGCGQGATLANIHSQTR
jgi:hypothetical protein